MNHFNQSFIYYANFTLLTSEFVQMQKCNCCICFNKITPCSVSVLGIQVKESIQKCTNHTLNEVTVVFIHWHVFILPTIEL